MAQILLGVRKSAWQALSVRDRQIVRYLASDRLQLGVPTTYDNAGTEWYAFSDGRFDLAGISWLGALVANIGDIPPGYTIPTIVVDTESGPVDTGEVDKAQLRSDAKGFLAPKRVWPVTIADDDPNPWQTVLDAQGTPPAVQITNAVPSGWTVVGSTA